MTATVEAARAKDAKGPIRPPGHGFLSRVPEGFATFFGALGLLCVLLAFIAPLRRVLRPVVRFLDLLIVPVSANLAYAVFLFLLAAATAARKRIAWWLVVVYLGLLVLTDVLGVALGLYAESLPSLIVCALLLVLLIVARGQFYAASRRAAVRRALTVLLIGLAVAILAGWGLVALFPGTLPTSQHLGWAADRVCGGLVSARSFGGRPPRALYFLLGLFGALALLNAATVLFRSQRLEAALHGDEEDRIRALLKSYGGHDSLGYFATRRDKAVVFSPSGKAAVTYRVEVGVCLASGDPVGDREAWPHAIAAWLDLARRHGWAPAVMGASEGRRARLRPRRTRRPPARRRGDPARRRLRPRRPRHARHPPGRRPGPPRRCHLPHPPSRHPHRHGDGGGRRPRRRLARHRDRTRLLHGPGPPRRPGRRRLPPG